jgi:hypothetical protein
MFNAVRFLNIYSSCILTNPQDNLPGRAAQLWIALTGYNMDCLLAVDMLVTTDALR